MEKKSLISKWFGGTGGTVETPATETMAPATPPVPEQKPNIWGMSGRATQMQIRTLMQLRTFQSKV